LGLPIPQLLNAAGVQLSNSANSARKVGDAFGYAYIMVTGARGDQVQEFHGTILAFLFESAKSSGIPFKGGYGNTCKKTYSITAFTKNSYLVMISGDSRVSSPTACSTPHFRWAYRPTNLILAGGTSLD
jgi:hypothetical protein